MLSGPRGVIQAPGPIGSPITGVLWIAREREDIGKTEPTDLAGTTEAAWTIAVDGYNGAGLLITGAEPGSF